MSAPFPADLGDALYALKMIFKENPIPDRTDDRKPRIKRNSLIQRMAAYEIPVVRANQLVDHLVSLGVMEAHDPSSKEGELSAVNLRTLTAFGGADDGTALGTEIMPIRHVAIDRETWECFVNSVDAEKTDAKAGGADNDAGGKTPSNLEKKAKKSTQKGDAEAKLIAALTAHHRYADGGSLNMEIIGNNELARKAEVDKASASAFFKAHFKGHGKYTSICRDPKALVNALKVLNGDFAPHELFGKAPPNETEQKD